MYAEIVGTILTSLGGATVLIGALAHFLGKIWTARIIEDVSHKYKSQLESIRANNRIDLEETKAKNTEALEDFKHKSNILLNEQEQFAGISLELYQKFFEQRVETYLELLKVKNYFHSNFDENPVVEAFQGHGHIYYKTYTKFRDVITNKQLYISNDLDDLFDSLRMKSSSHYRDIQKAHESESQQVESIDAAIKQNEALQGFYKKFAEDTHDDMLKLLQQIDADVKKLRSRVELDKN